MRYHWFRQRGLFAGSGAVEASCKTVTGQRAQAVRHALDRQRSRRHRNAQMHEHASRPQDQIRHPHRNNAGRLTSSASSYRPTAVTKLSSTPDRRAAAECRPPAVELKS